MRLLFVCATGGSGRQQLGGAERFLIEMLPEFSKKMEIAALVPEGAVAVELRAMNVDVLTGGPKKRIDPSYCAEIRRAVRRFKPDLVSAHLLSAAMHTRALSPRDIPSARLAVTLHNSLQQYIDTSERGMRGKMRFNLLLDRLQRGMRPHTSVAVSRFEAAELERVKFRGPVVCIPNPLPRNFDRSALPASTYARNALGLPLRGRIFAYVGRMEYEKGADLLDSIAAALDDGDVLATFGEGVIRPTGPRVLNMGRTNNPELIWAAVDAVVMPSRVESFGRVALEAAASGTPVVHTGVGGLDELLSRGEGTLSYATQLKPTHLARNLVAASGGSFALKEQRAALADAYSEDYAFEKKVHQWCDMFTGMVRRHDEFPH